MESPLVERNSGVYMLTGGMPCYSNICFDWCLQDVLKFGFSTREYVILTEKSQDIEEDDEPAVEDEHNTTEQNKT